MFDIWCYIMQIITISGEKKSLGDFAFYVRLTRALSDFTVGWFLCTIWWMNHKYYIYRIYILYIYILYDIFIHMYPKIFQSLNDWSNIYIYIHVSHGDINDEPLFHIYIPYIYILYQDLTHDNPIISSVGHFLSPKKKGVAIDAGTRSAATRLSASWCCMGARQSFRCFRPEKKTKPKEVWDNSLWDL
jgi:hypothetical protein